MKVKEEHRELLKGLGLTEDDFRHFDGENVTYEFDEEKGVRIYDPQYVTSYDEYIDVDGWSAWSSEQDTFMSEVLKKAREETERKVEANPKATQEQITESMKKKFGKDPDSVPEPEPEKE